MTFLFTSLLVVSVGRCGRLPGGPDKPGGQIWVHEPALAGASENVHLAGACVTHMHDDLLVAGRALRRLG
jgi:hypothetical protein